MMGHYILSVYSELQIMSRRIFVACIIAIAVKGLAMSGAGKEIVSFRPWVNIPLVGGILSNLIVLIAFAELYWQVDQDEDHVHFGFSSAIDAYYFSIVTSSSVGYGDYLPKTPRQNCSRAFIFWPCFSLCYRSSSRHWRSEADRSTRRKCG